MKITDLQFDKRNARKRNKRAAETIEHSLRELGAGRSVVIDKNGQIIAGNGVIENAAKAGITDVEVVQTDGIRIIAVQRTDLDLDADDKARQLAIADNRTAELAEWNPEVLANLSAELDLKPFFTDAELRSILPPSPNDGEDDTPELPTQPVTKRGDLYLLGSHRLLCGDSTCPTDVDRLLDGQKPVLMATDPPYGVTYDPTWRDGKGGFSTAPVLQRGTVENDDRADWREAWALFPGDVAYVWHGALHASLVLESLAASGFQIRSQIIWRKQQGVFSRGDYHWQHEPCWYAVRKGKTGHWAGDRKQSTVWEISTLNPTGKPAGPEDERVGHGTQKPVECMRRPILNNSQPHDIVYDPFLGSGSTLIAAESEGRICYGMELDPTYCDVIVARWEKFTGKKAVRNARND